MCMASYGKDNKHTIHITRIMHFVSNGEKCKMHKIGWCEGGLLLVYIVTNNVDKTNLTQGMKYITVILEN